MKKTIRKTTIADRLLFLFLIVSSIAGLVYSREAFSQGSDVVVELDGKPLYTLSLDTDRKISIQGAHGGAVVEIKNGKARMKDADCPNRICVKQGWISKGTIVCLPNRIVIIVGSGIRKDIDAITG